MFTTMIINTVLVAIVVMLHYEILRTVSNILPKLTIAFRLRIVVGIFGALLAHIIEIWIFALAYYLMLQWDLGEFEGNFDGSLLDCAYFSFSTFTTLGFGDIAPLGPIRFLTGLESLTGLVLITWSASFLFIEMTKFWNHREA